MNPALIRTFDSMPERQIVEQLGWEAFLKYKEASYWRQNARYRARFTITQYMGMTPDEYLCFVGHGTVSDRVKKVWT